MNNINIHWYPGHMSKARGKINELVREVDVVVEVRDARIPLSSQNPDLKTIIKNKPHIVVLNKSDLADAKGNKIWLDWHEDQEQFTMLVSSKNYRQRKKDLKLITDYSQKFIRKSRITGEYLRIPRILIVGIPNVGKSSLINYLTGRKAARTGAKPGLTRGKQMVTVSNQIQILDTPGVLWPKLDDRAAAIKLAATGAIKDTNFEIDDIIEYIVYIVAKEVNWYDYAENYAQKRNFLLPNNVLDINRAKQSILVDFHEGLLGKYTLELPENEY